MRIRFCVLFLFLLIFVEHSNAQKEAGNWYFGDRAGLNFNSGSAVPALNGELQTVEGSATISDRDGNLLFYTDGSTVYTKRHGIMPNGRDLKGNVSSTQSAIIVPRPGNPLKYYIFTVDKPDYFRTPNDPLEGVHYSEVDISLNSGRGAVVQNQKNIPLITYDPNDPVEREFKSSEKISAVVSGNCISYWVVTQFVNKFYAFTVSSDGVDPDPVISTTPSSFPPIINQDSINLTAPGYMKISPNGKKLAIAFTSTSLGSESAGTKNNGKVYLYDFNDVTGKVNNEQLIYSNTYPYGVEFSADSKKLYVTANIYNNQDRLQSGDLYQFDLESNDILGSKYLIHSSTNVAGALQLAINGKIYRAGYPQSGGAIHHNFLSVINNPEAPASSVDYDHNSIDISPRDVKLGLPPFVQSLLNKNFEAENFCLGTATKFTLDEDTSLDSVSWEFGDGSTSTEENPTHTYASPGTFVVSLTKYINGIPQDPVCEEVTIVGFKEAAQNYTLTQCDITDNDPEDGITDFNLQIARDFFTGGDNNLRVLFYENLEDAENDNLNQEGLSDVYRNNSPDQILVAKISGYNSECSSYAKFDLATSSSQVTIDTKTVTGCDNGNGSADFDLTSIANDVRNDLNLSQNTSITFHEDQEDAILGENPLPNHYNSKSGTIYVKVNSDETCYSFGTLKLQIAAFPQLQQEYNLQLCSDNFPIVLGDDIQITNQQNFTYEWSTGESSPTIQVKESGIYNLKLVDKNIGCERNIEFEVEKIEAPQITEIQVDNIGVDNDITIITDSENTNTVYALDNIAGPYQSSPFFRNVPGGDHIVYVKNEQACEIGKEEITLFGFPAFFTPNNDGYNDLWKPYDTDIPDFKIHTIYIFDRYGKLLKQLSPEDKGWDGNFNGRPMPSNDYWFDVHLENGKVITSHFSLVRG